MVLASMFAVAAIGQCIVGIQTNRKDEPLLPKYSEKKVHETTQCHLFPTTNWQLKAKSIQNITISTMANDSMHWEHKWLLETIKGQQPRIYFVHVGKTGGTSLERSVLPKELQKRRAILCLAQNSLQKKQMQRLQQDPGKIKLGRGIGSFRSTDAMNRSTFDNIWLECLRNSTANLASSSKLSTRERAMQDFDHFLSRQPSHSLFRHVLWHLHIHPKPSGESYVLINVVNTFLFTVRSPLMRLVSAFNFERRELNRWLDKKGPKISHRHVDGWDDQVDVHFLNHCFRDMDHVAQELLLLHDEKEHNDVEGKMPNSTTKSDDSNFATLSRTYCINLARKTLPGNGPLGDFVLQHFYFNYQQYMRQTIDQRPDAAVLVVRMSHLWDDVQGIQNALATSSPSSSSSLLQSESHDLLMNKSNHKNDMNAAHDDNNDNKSNDSTRTITQPEAAAIQPIHVTHGSEKYGRSGIQTVEGRRVVCCLIWDELKAYHRLVAQAINLNMTEKCEAMEEMLNDCHIHVTEGNNDTPLTTATTRTTSSALLWPSSSERFRAGKVSSSALSSSSSQLASSQPQTSSNEQILLLSIPCRLMQLNEPLPWDQWYNQTCCFSF
ncbi:hypothetical protein ACA910_019079 [Epithemia clementina (nom. ined.)]